MQNSKNIAASKTETTPRAYKLTSHVFLIGFMGAGKTSVSRKLARTCGLASIDVDTYIERSANKKIAEIFEDVGEAGFRKIETGTLQEICEMKEPLIVSCGGGIITTPENIEIMKSAGVVVLLKVSAESAAAHIRNTETRPLFNDMESARERLSQREPLYKQAADIVINTKDKSIREITYELKKVLMKKGVLCPI